MLKYLKLCIMLYNIGIFGMLGTKRHLIIIFMAFELVLVGLGVVMVVFSVYLDDLIGVLYAISIFTVGASESAIGLTLVVLFFKLNGSIAIDYINKLCENFTFIKG